MIDLDLEVISQTHPFKYGVKGVQDVRHSLCQTVNDSVSQWPLSAL